jgi:hypothetical protein
MARTACVFTVNGDTRIWAAISLLQLARPLQSSRVVGRLDAVLEELVPFRTVPLVSDLTEQVNLTGITNLRT